MSNRRVLMFCLVALGGVGLISARVWSQDDEPESKPRKKKMTDHGAGGMPGMPDPAQMAEMMKKCTAAGKPGENHKALEHFIGEWNSKTKMWMDPNAPPSESRGHSKTKWIMDGRFIMDEYSGDMVMPNEKGEMVKSPFKGMGLTGYDNAKNLFVGNWIDTMSTGMYHSTGSFNPMTQTLQMWGQMDDVAMGVFGKMVRYETKILGTDEHVFTMYDCHAGVDYKVMEIAYTRAK